MGATLSGRDRAILRAVGGGTAELEATDLYVDGRHCCDQFAARRLTTIGLITTDGPARSGVRVPARLTVAGREMLRAC
jgi:hypothetical protein